MGHNILTLSKGNEQLNVLYLMLNLQEGKSHLEFAGAVAQSF